MRFFLAGVEETAIEATSTARAIRAMRELHRAMVLGLTGANGGRLLDLLFMRPIVNVNLIAETLGIAFATANGLVSQFEAHGFLQETTGGRRNRVFRYSPYLELFS